MKTLHFPTTIVDDFLDYPDEVREFALQQEFTSDSKHAWPGKRTKHLHILSPNLFNSVMHKIVSLYYNLDKTGIEWVVDSCFQLVDSKYKNGWVHQDDNLATAIIYLSKTNNNSGTTIYRPIDPLNALVCNTEQKQESFKNTNLIENFDSHKVENNKQFKPSITVEAEYNRLVLFDAHLYHSANDFCGEQDIDSRLTLLIFITRLNVHESHLFPISRSKLSTR